MDIDDNYVSIYIKERLTEVLIKDKCYRYSPKGIRNKIEKEIPIIKKHDTYYSNDLIVIDFWYYLSGELVKNRLELDLKKEIRDYKLSNLLK